MPAPQRRQLEIVIRATDRPLARCLVRRGRYIIGHLPSNEIIVDEPSVSGRHARLTVVSDSEIYIEDFGSANGTFADGQPCQNLTRVQYDSVIQLGQCTLEFQRAGLPAEVFQKLPEGFLSSRRFERNRPLVTGSISQIFEAQDISLAREVAIRVMQPEAQFVPRSVLRFIREAQITAQLQHPNIPPVYEMRINEEGQLYYTTRAIEGESLGSIVARVRAGTASPAQWSLPALLTVFQKTCDAIAFAHSRGVMHCALQPENIVVGEFGELLVLGWTYSIVLEENSDPEAKRSLVHASGEASPSPVTSCTAPEQVSGTGLFDERADIYALGAILYFILAYELPFPEQDEQALAERILAGHINPPQIQGPLAQANGSADRLRNRLIEIAMKALSTAPQNRYGSVLELQADLSAWQEGLLINEPEPKKWKAMLARRQ